VSLKFARENYCLAAGQDGWMVGSKTCLKRLLIVYQTNKKGIKSLNSHKSF
jgi:hypothetical protein